MATNPMSPEERIALEDAHKAWEERVRSAFAKLTLPTDQELEELRLLIMSGGPNMSSEYIVSRDRKDLWSVLREVSDNAFWLRSRVGRRSTVPQ